MIFLLNKMVPIETHNIPDSSTYCSFGQKYGDLLSPKGVQCHSGRLSVLGGLAVMTRAWNMRDQGSIPH